MVAIRGGANLGRKQFVQNFAKHNAASQDDKYNIRDVRESLTEEEKTKIQPTQLRAFYSLPLEKSSQTLTLLTLPFKNAQYGISNISPNSSAEPASVNLTNNTILTIQSTYTHWARAKTSATKTSSTANRYQPQYVIITKSNMDCNIVMANQLIGNTEFSVDLVLISGTLPKILATRASVNLVPTNTILPNSLVGTSSVSLVPVSNILPDSSGRYNTKLLVGPRYNKKEDNQIYKFNQGHTPYSPQEFRRTNHQPIHGTYDP
jgi:hypothetical protein